MMRLFLDPPIITSSETRLWLDCCDAQSESGGGHLQRIDGVGAVSGPAPIATDWRGGNHNHVGKPMGDEALSHFRIRGKLV